MRKTSAGSATSIRTENRPADDRVPPSRQGTIARVRIAMLGPLEVDHAGRPVEVGGARLRTLMILLALDVGRVVTSQRLIDGLWGDEPPAGAANALQALVSRLRRALPPDVIESHPTGYRLAVEPDAVDARRFERLVAAGRAGADTRTLTEALALWRGPALADVARAPFARAPVARLTELRLSALEDRVELELAAGAGTGLVAELDALVAEHPLRERLAGQLMRALVAAGRPADALAVYQRVRQRLADELGADPAPALSTVYLSILREPPPERPAADALTNLRSGLTSFVGRDDDLTRVAKLVGESRLTTLVGPGGAGKTRLAVESGRALLEQAPDGVWLVELAPLSDEAHLVHAVLGVLGIREHGLIGAGPRPTAPTGAVDPVQRLVGALARRRALLIFDNCEHVIGEAARLADRLLGECPQLRILATSREPLGITGESLWPVEPLPEESAIRLLADRAAAVRPGFAVGEHNRDPVVRICRALDGMPLAIELAAARLRTMTPDQVAARLDDRFRLLTSGSRTALPRHQTLRAVVDWSWDLLAEPERALLRRLAVFAGGATLDAAERVCADDGLPATAVLDVLTALADKSLVVIVGGRYALLETIRAYGLEKLAEVGEAERLRTRHAEYFLALAERAEPYLRTRDQLPWLAAVVAEHDNLHAALRRAIAARQARLAVRLASALGWYWWLRGHRAEGSVLAAEAAALAGAVSDEERARAGEAAAPTRAVAGAVSDEERALAYAYIALNTFAAGGDFAQAKHAFARAIALGRGTRSASPVLRMIAPMAAFLENDGERAAMRAIRPLFDDPEPWVAALARGMHAHAMQNLGDIPGAEAGFDASLAQFRALGERWGISFALSSVAEAALRRGDYAAAVSAYEEALTLVTELGTNEDLPQAQARYAHALWSLGDRTRANALLSEALDTAERLGAAESIASVLYSLGEIARQDGWPETAREHLQRAAAVLSGVFVSPQFTAMIQCSLGYLDGAAGDVESARVHHTAALALALSSRDAPVIGHVATGAADLAIHEGSPARAAELLGAAEAIRGAPDRTLLDTDRIAAAARAALGETEFVEAYARGRRSTVDTIVALSTLTPDA